MEIKIAGTTFDKFNEVDVSLRYDSVASTFSFRLFFDPANKTHRDAFKPGINPSVTITHNGERLITGVLLSYRFKSSAIAHWVSVSGYSKTGVLEDCQLDPAKAVQYNSMTLKQIAEDIIKPYGLKLIVDDTVAAVCDTVIPTTAPAEVTETCKDFLSRLAGQVNVILSHNAYGNLLLTGYKTKTTVPGRIVNNSVTPLDSSLAGNQSKAAAPDTVVNKKAIFHFGSGMPGVEFNLDFDGQKQHSTIQAQGQYGGGNALVAPVDNPYAAGFRPKVIVQTSGTDIQSAKAVRNALSDELKAIRLVIKLLGWDLNGRLAKPGDIISITNVDLHIYNTANFFIEQADYIGNKDFEMCNLICVVPETFNNDNPKNIFA